jgi:hypothetical protein
MNIEARGMDLLPGNAELIAERQELAGDIDRVLTSLFHLDISCLDGHRDVRNVGLCGDHAFAVHGDPPRRLLGKRNDGRKDKTNCR